MTNPWGAPGVWTSGRRTYKGNRLVGGVPNSDHLRGEAADFAGVSEAALRKHFGNKVRYLNEGDHIHVAGLKDVPYHGQRGVAGLVNGVDTTAPKGNQMLPNPRRLPGQNDPITAALSRMTPTQGGFDPLAPAPEPYYPQPVAPPQMHNPQQALATQMTMPPEGKPKTFGKGGAGWAILGAIGDALSAYGGQRGVYAPALMDQRQMETQERMHRERMTAEAQERLARASKPIEHTNSAGDLLRIDPQTGHAEVVYLDPNGKPQYQRVENPETGGMDIVNNGSTPRPNENHIRHLLSTGDKQNFDAKFGPGTADYILRTYGGAR